ncbi:hypothetical protein LUZ60_011601 [Juncus effusus]|nr:hypothetical protein LUZ60_011601 [Juncus effusus]
MTFFSFDFKRAFGSGTSSSYISTPEENCQDFVVPYPKREPIDNNINNNPPLKEKKQCATLSKCMLNGEVSKISPLKRRKNKELRKPNSSSFAPSSTWVCRNLACKNNVSSEESFCRRCSCCLCHRFDDNKDPSLWLVCSSEGEGDERDFCGASCHVECAIEQGRVGCLSIGQALTIDGSYCCASCGKISAILRFWRRQLEKAKESRRVDNLCHRIFIAFKLFDRTNQFEELHQISCEAKAKLETEVGPLDGVSAKMARGIVSRLPVSGQVQRLCSLGVEKADELLASSHQGFKFRDSLPAACRFRFEQVGCSSLVVILRETPLPEPLSIKGYKLWYWKNRVGNSQHGPHILQKRERRVLIDNLDPCAEYCFRVVSFTEEGDLGHSESKCFTQSVEFVVQRAGARLRRNRDSTSRTFRSSGFKIRNVGRVLRRAWAEDGSFEGLFTTNEEEQETGKDSSDEEEQNHPQTGTTPPRQHSVSRHLDLNFFAVPDLNVEADDSGADSHTFQEKENEKENENGGGMGAGELDEDYEYCVKVVRWLECSGYIDKVFRMRFLTWFSLGSGEEERRVVLTFIRTLIDDPISLGGQLEDSFMDVVSCKRPVHEFRTKLWY